MHPSPFSYVIYKGSFRKLWHYNYSFRRKELILLIFVVDINCEVTSGFYSIRCVSRRPGSLRVDAFRGHGLSLLEKTTLRGLRTRAIPANVFGGASNRSPRSHHPPLTRTMKWLYAEFCTHTTIANGSKCNTSEEKHGDSLKKEPAFSACGDSQRSFPCPVGAEA